MACPVVANLPGDAADHGVERGHAQSSAGARRRRSDRRSLGGRPAGRAGRAGHRAGRRGPGRRHVRGCRHRSPAPAGGAAGVALPAAASASRRRGRGQAGRGSDCQAGLDHAQQQGPGPGQGTDGRHGAAGPHDAGGGAAPVLRAAPAVGRLAGPAPADHRGRRADWRAWPCSTPLARRAWWTPWPQAARCPACGHRCRSAAGGISMAECARLPTPISRPVSTGW